MDDDYKKENIEAYKREKTDRPTWGKQWHNDSMKYLVDEGPEKSQTSILQEINEEFGLIVGLASELSRVNSFSKNLIGINIALDEIKKTKKNDRDVELIVCDAENLPFKNCIFGCIFAHATLHHMEPTRVLPELNRVTTSGGHLVFSEPGLYNPIAMIERKFLPTSIHVKSEKPFDPSVLRKMMLNYYGKIANENYFFFLTPLLPVIAKYFPPFRNKKFIHSCYLFDNYFVNKFLKKFSWIIVMNVIKSK